MTQRDEDLTLLYRILKFAADLEDEDAQLPARTIEAFSEMKESLALGMRDELTEKQRRWANGVAEKLFDEPAYENLYSRGLVPEGRPVPTPAALQKLPMKPPTRKTAT